MSSCGDPSHDVQRLSEVARAQLVAPAGPVPTDEMVTLSLTASADAEHVTELRHTLRDWLASQRLPAGLGQDVLLAATEAVSNVVDHAYRDKLAGPVAVSLRRTDSELLMTVADQGSWRVPPADPGTRGHGLRLIRAVAHDVDIDAHAGGTTVTARFVLPPSSPVGA